MVDQAHSQPQITATKARPSRRAFYLGVQQKGRRRVEIGDGFPEWRA
jgi:hypothetical protein